MNILMINIHSNRNAGDAVLVKMALAQLEGQFPGCKINLSVDDLSSFPADANVTGSFGYHGKKRDSAKWSIIRIIRMVYFSLLAAVLYCVSPKIKGWLLPGEYKKLINFYEESNIIISAPGNFLYSSGKGISLLIHYYAMFYALLLGKPLFLFPQSIGPFRRQWETRLCVLILSKAQLVMVREKISLEFLLTKGLDRHRCIYVPDLAFTFRTDHIHATKDWLTENNIVLFEGPFLGLTVIKWGTVDRNFYRQEEYEKAIFNVVNFFIKEYKGKVFFFPHVTADQNEEDDRVTMHHLEELLSCLTNRVFFIKNPASPEILMTAYSMMDIFIGTRMHSNIFAMIGGVPVIAIAYQHKTQGIMELMELNEWVLPIDDLAGDILITRLRKLWGMRDQIRKKIADNVKILSEQASKAGQMIDDRYQQLQ
jgi:colanic acid/amylovoran biosynthesis protein